MSNPNVGNENSNQVRNHSVLPFVNNRNELLLLFIWRKLKCLRFPDDLLKSCIPVQLFMFQISFVVC